MSDHVSPPFACRAIAGPTAEGTLKGSVNHALDSREPYVTFFFCKCPDPTSIHASIDNWKTNGCEPFVRAHFSRIISSYSKFIGLRSMIISQTMGEAAPSFPSSEESSACNTLSPLNVSRFYSIDQCVVGRCECRFNRSKRLETGMLNSYFVDRCFFVGDAGGSESPSRYSS